jgi:hypothetical protein
LLFGAALIFAVGATLTLVFATNSQWLKLAVIAALWAAFFGAMLSVKYRHQAAARAGEVADLQAVYELELEREVAARREYELEVEADTRRRIAEENSESSREDIAALRTELHALRENLERLTGGEVLVERFALRAQSTRMRTIGGDPMTASAIAADEAPRSITAGPARQAPGRPQTVDAVLDPSTQLLEPAPRPQRPRSDSQRLDSQRPANQRPDGPRSRQDNQRPRQDNQRRREESAGQRRPEPPHVPAQSTGEQSGTNLRRGPVPPMPRQPANTGAAPIMVRAAANARQAETGANPIIGRPNPNSGAYPVGGHRPSDSGVYPVGGPRSSDSAPYPVGGRHLSDSRLNDSGVYPVGGRHPSDSGYPVGGHRPSDSGAYPVGGRHPGNSGAYPVAGRQPDGTGANPVVSRPTGNRMPARQPDDAGAMPTRFAAPVPEPEYREGGRHGSGSYEPVPRPVPAMAAASAGGRRAQPDPAGAHTAGRSVTELLAAHAAEESPRRHRRRAD